MIEGEPRLGSSQEAEAPETRGRIFFQEGIPHPQPGVRGPPQHRGADHQVCSYAQASVLKVNIIPIMPFSI